MAKDRSGINIAIGPDLLVTADQYQFILNEMREVKSGNKAGQRVPVPVSYHPTIEKLVHALCLKTLLTQRDSDDLRSLRQNFTEAVDKLTKAVEEVL